METIFMNTLSSKINEPHKFLNHTNHKKKKRNEPDKHKRVRKIRLKRFK